MTDQPIPHEPPYWWHGADGAKVIRAAWKAVEDVSKLGAEASITFRKEGEPTLTIAFDWDLTEEDEAELLADLPDGQEPYDPSDFPPQPSAAEEADDDEPTAGEPDEDGF